MFQAITETLVLVCGPWRRFLKRHSLLGDSVSGVVACGGRMYCIRYVRHTFFRALNTLRHKRFRRLRLRQVRVSRRLRRGIRKSTAPRMGARRGAGTNLFRSVVIELVSTSLAV